MKGCLCAITLVLAALASADSVVLIPLDNRPASGQYAEITATIGGLKVLTPPELMLGNYTIPGSPDAILRWLGSQDLSDCRALIISLDMICYGSLFESRKNGVTEDQARARLKQLLDLRKKAPQAKLYLFGSIMRLTPSATHDASSYRLALAEFVRFRAQNPSDPRLPAIKKQLPPGVLEAYDAARARNQGILKTLVNLAQGSGIDLALIGQDDAATDGPQVAERKLLTNLIQDRGVAGRVQFCEGVDQLSSDLVSRVALAGRSPAVRVKYADETARSQIFEFETQPLAVTISDQLVASGAHEARPGETPDYTLYVDVPTPSSDLRTRFLEALAADVDAGKPCAVADVDLSKDTAAPNQALFDLVNDKGRPLKLLAYAAWNTAANTVGSAVATANAYLASRAQPTLDEELAHKQMLLMRLTNDFAFHTYTRQVAYDMVDGPHAAAIFGKDFYDVNDYVKRDLEKYLKKMFFTSFLGRSFSVGAKRYRYSGITDLKVGLPWPRPYEVRLDFSLEASEQS